MRKKQPIYERMGCEMAHCVGAAGGGIVVVGNRPRFSVRNPKKKIDAKVSICSL